MVTNNFTTLLKRLNTSHIKSYRRIELQSTSTGRCLRVTKHNANLLTKLVDEDNNTVGLRDNTRQLTKSLRHQSCL